MIGGLLKKIAMLIAIVVIFGFLGIIETVNKISSGHFVPTDIVSMFADALNNGFSSVPSAVMSIVPAFQQGLMGTMLMNIFVIALLWTFIYTIISIVPSQLAKEYGTKWKIITAIISLLIVMVLGILTAPHGGVDIATNGTLSQNVSNVIANNMNPGGL